MTDFHKADAIASIHRHAFLKTIDLGTLVGSGDAIGDVFDRLFAVPSRDATHCTPH
ncbi:MAG: hypothetical protein P0119_08200 [Nitrospira sp.]|nr:hypothetical protein [Nitrospira sp.]